MPKPSQSDQKQSLSLQETLDHLLKTEGYVSLKTFMRLCLLHPTDGYYTSKNHIIGQRGDFVTAPEVSQLFGEIIAIWAVHQWQELGSPKKFALVEAGPGQGTLMDDVLRTSEVDPGFIKAANIHCIEINPSLKETQKTVFKKYKLTPHYHEDIYSLKSIREPVIFIANEFYDTFPIQHFKKDNGVWQEIVITKDQSEKLVPSTTQTDDSASLSQLYPWAFESDKAEISTESLIQHEHLLSLLRKNGGAALIIDYGSYQQNNGYTLQAIHNQKKSDLLEELGNSDLTAHVNFDHLKKITDAPFCHIETQAAFLKRYGIQLRLRRLFESPDIMRKNTLKNGYHRLIDEDQMGNLFKTLHCAYPIPK